MIETLIVASERTPLDLLLWRRYRREVAGLVEDTFARNPGLADMGPNLVVGTHVLVSVPPPEPQGAQTTPVVSLYD